MDINDKFQESVIDCIAAQYSGVTARSDEYTDVADRIRASLHKEQLDFIIDPWRNKAAVCPRRAGKSWTAMAYAFDTCLRKPRAAVVVCTLTLKHAKTVYWTEMMYFAEQFGLTLDYHIADMRVSFKNGATIMLIGVESMAEVERLRGGKFDLVLVDEGKSYPERVLRNLLDDVVTPALGDRQGTLGMIGTPGNILKGPFYEATFPGFEKKLENSKRRYVSRTWGKPEEHWSTATYKPKWSRHTWSRKANLAQPHLWTEALEKKEENGWDDMNPIWRREYLGEWVNTVGSFVYAYAYLSQSDPDKVQWQPRMGADGLGLPQASDWSFVMGLDLGFEDDYAIVVCAYSSTLKAMYHVYDFKDNHKDVYEIANKVLQVYHRFGGRFSAMVADAAGLGGMVIETLNKRYGLSFVRAEKKEKFDHVELMNSDFMTGRLKIVPGTSLDLELQMLQWNIQEDESKGDLAKLGKLKEISSLPNHLCDALLYAWRFSHHFWSEEYVSPPDYGSPEWNKRYRQSVLEEMLSKREDRLDKIGNEPYNIGRLLEDDGWN